MSENQDGHIKNWMPFEKARDYVRSLNLSSVEEWASWCKSGNKLDNIPTGASRVYKNRGWDSWADFLGTRRRRGKGWLTYAEARKIIAALGLKSQADWRKLV